uniref:NADH dehydrogenase [ubiquinone] 1 beta subcomplex subunit 6 n=1 Tax=Anisakis simplex TaxID=6269 RepID=A0A0M3JG54_ANISI
LMVFVALETMYYYWKYEVKDWEHLRGIESMPLKQIITKEKVRLSHSFLSRC